MNRTEIEGRKRVTIDGAAAERLAQLPHELELMTGYGYSPPQGFPSLIVSALILHTPVAQLEGMCRAVVRQRYQRRERGVAA